MVPASTVVVGVVLAGCCFITQYEIDARMDRDGDDCDDDGGSDAGAAYLLLGGGL